MPSPYVKKGYGEVSRRAEERIIDDITVRCKVCKGVMKLVTLMTDDNSITGKVNPDKPDRWFHCTICLRNICVTQL